LKHLLTPLVCCVAFASTAVAQLSNYLGPGVLTDGAGTIGSRSGEQVDLRYFANVNGVYDNGVQTLSVDSKGNLVQPGPLEGVEVLFGAYGSHSWRTGLLGLDFRGDYRDYVSNSYYDGSDDSLTIGYTYQKSRRLYFDFRGIGGTYSNYLGSVPGGSVSIPNAINQSNLLLFDNRTDFLQGFASMTYLLTPRASITVGGNGFYVGRQSSELIGMEGYTGRARFQYRVSRATSIGGSYERTHYQYPGSFGNADMNNYNFFLATQFGRWWTFSMQGGAYQVNTLGLQTVALDPSIALLLGVSSTEQTFLAKDWLPAGQANLSRKFKDANLTFLYSRTMSPGNGVYLTSRSEGGNTAYSYTGIRKLTFTIGGGYTSLSSLGQGIAPYKSYVGSSGLTYNMTHALHLVARYDLRQQEIKIAGYRATSYRLTLGLAFSPGALPLSLW
jgi:hypothetical protein